MKNNDIIELNQWKKRNQTCEIHNKPEGQNAETCKDRFITPTEIDEQFNIELEKDLLSGMIIW